MKKWEFNKGGSIPLERGREMIIGILSVNPDAKDKIVLYPVADHIFLEITYPLYEDLDLLPSSIKDFRMEMIREVADRLTSIRVAMLPSEDKRKEINWQRQKKNVLHKKDNRWRK